MPDRLSGLPQLLAIVRQWEMATYLCPLVLGMDDAICGRCQLEKWKHYLLPLFECDGSGLVSILHLPKEDRRTWRCGCKGCKEQMNMPKLARMWYAHRHFPRVDDFGAYPNDLFPTLPFWRKCLCSLHGNEKVGSWLLCGIIDFLLANHPAIAAQMVRWVKKVDPTWSRQEVHNPKTGVAIKRDRMLGGTVAKKIFCYGPYCTNQVRLQAWNELVAMLPAVEGDFEVCTRPTDGTCPKLARGTDPSADGSHPLVTEHCRDVLRVAFRAGRRLLRMDSEVVITTYEEQAMQLQRVMVSGPLGQYGCPFFERHPTIHYQLVHAPDIMKAQQHGYPHRRAVVGRLIANEAGENTHLLHALFAGMKCRHSPAGRTEDLVRLQLLLLALEWKDGYVCTSRVRKAGYH